MSNDKILSFTDLVVWREGHKLVLQIYIETKHFPDDERFGLTSQLRRAAVSITSNVAEGFGRWSYKDKLRFYYNSLGSLFELQNELLVARDAGYISSERFAEMAEQTITVHRLLNSFISSTKQHDSKF